MATPRPSVPRPVLIAGPTASGKSALALALGERVGGEIVSVDSMQVYRGLDIGTAKPSAADLARVPHHLIDVVELTQPFDAARFVALAKETVGKIQSRGNVPILCGGTGLYFKAYLEGLGDSPPMDSALRAQLEVTPPVELLKELEQSDRATFEKIDRKNLRRIIRAVEVIRLTGKPFSSQRAVWQSTGALPGDEPACLSFGVRRAPEDLRARIAARVDQMFQRGLVQETERLLELGLAQNRTAMQAIGYRQVIDHLNGKRSLEETVELVKLKTRQFAKRQLTWFNRQLKLRWLDVGADDGAAVQALENGL